MFKDVKACATGVERVEDDGIDKDSEGKGCYHFKVTCTIGDEVLDATDVFEKSQADKCDKDAGCTDSCLHVACQNVSFLSDWFFVHVTFKCRFFTKGKGSQSIHNQVNPKDLNDGKWFLESQEW